MGQIMLLPIDDGLPDSHPGSTRQSGGETGTQQEDLPGPCAWENGDTGCSQRAAWRVPERGCPVWEAGKWEKQAGPGQLKTFVLKAAAVTWGNSRENTR